MFEKLEFNDFKDNIFKDDAVQSTSASLKLLRISSLQKKWSLPFRVSSVNVTKSAENWLIYCISLTFFWTLIQGQKNSNFKNYFQIRFKYKSWWSINLDLDHNEKSQNREKILPYYCFSEAIPKKKNTACTFELLHVTFLHFFLLLHFFDLWERLFQSFSSFKLQYIKPNLPGPSWYK